MINIFIKVTLNLLVGSVLAGVLVTVSAAESSTPTIDYNVSTGGRWLPKSGGIWGGVGANFQLWDARQTSSAGAAMAPASVVDDAVPGAAISPAGTATKNAAAAATRVANVTSVAYGYFRPVVRAATSGTVNQIQLDLNIFPISFLGVTLGHAVSYRSKDFEDLPCGANLCTGNLQTTDARAQLLFEYRNWFFVTTQQFAWVKSSDESKNFIDESTMLANTKTGDHYLNSEITVGYKFSANWSSGLNFGDTRVTAAQNINTHRSVFLSYKENEKLSYLAGIGFYESTLQARDTTFYGIIRWQGGESLALVR